LTDLHPGGFSYKRELPVLVESAQVGVSTHRTYDLAHRICEQTRRLPEASSLELERYIKFLEFKIERRHLLRERLAKDYELAASYEELAGELSDEVWSPAEFVTAHVTITQELDMRPGPMVSPLWTGTTVRRPSGWLRK